jgi:hypothetical protein
MIDGPELGQRSQRGEHAPKLTDQTPTEQANADGEPDAKRAIP